MRYSRFCTAAGFVFLLLLPQVGAAQRGTETHVEHRQLSQCYVYAPFDEGLFERRPSHDPNWDVISYELAYILRKNMLMVSFDAWGNRVFEREYVQEDTGFKHFEINERVGNEARLQRDIERYLRQNEIFNCKPSLL